MTTREKAYRNLLVQVADEVERTGRTDFSRGMIENLETLVDQEHEFSEELVSHAEELLTMIVGPEGKMYVTSREKLPEWRLESAVEKAKLDEATASLKVEIADLKAANEEWRLYTQELKAERQRFENVALDQQTVIRHLNDKVERLEKEILVLCRRAR